MGTDIYLHLEWRVPTRTDEEYRRAVRDGDIARVSQWIWFEKTPYGKDQDRDGYYNQYWIDPLTGENTEIRDVEDRSYNLFSKLAGVRLAREDEDWLLPDNQRGTPSDVVCPKFIEAVADGVRTPGWMTIEQLLAFDGWTELGTISTEFSSMLLSLRDRFPDMDGNRLGKDLRLLFYFD